MKYNLGILRWSLMAMFTIAGLVFLFIWLLPDEHGAYPVALRRLVGQVFQEGLTPEQASEKYVKSHFRILIVPGHDQEYSGAEFGPLKEADLNLALAKQLVDYLAQDSKLEILTTRDLATGNYRPEFASYFVNERAAINSFRARLRAQFLALIQSGVAEKKVIVSHNFARDEVAIRLYGINKWANEQGIDLVLHLHFNDDASRSRARSGDYRGFAIYIPEKQLPAHRLSRDLGEAIKQKLLLASPVSNLPQEAGGMIEDQELIAVGANGSRESASLLVEFGYIYEPQFLNSNLRSAALANLARLTAEGIRDYFASSR